MIYLTKMQTPCPLSTKASYDCEIMNSLGQVRFKTEGFWPKNITDRIKGLVQRYKLEKGLVNLSILHTSASLTIQENASKHVLSDIKTFLSGLAPESSIYLHDVEGPDDMPAHIKSGLLPATLTIPIENGKMTLGTWQGIYLVEHRLSARRREITACLLLAWCALYRRLGRAELDILIHELKVS